MFQAVEEYGGFGKTELEIASVADSISRDLGFGGRIRMRKWPMHHDWLKKPSTVGFCPFIF